MLLRSEGRLIAGPRARHLREEARLSLRDVGEALGVSHAAIARYEAGERAPRGAIAERYAAFLRALARQLDEVSPAAAGNKPVGAPAGVGSTAVGSHTLAGRDRPSSPSADAPVSTTERRQCRTNILSAA